MTNRDKYVEKINKEYEQYKFDLFYKGVEEVWNHAYEISLYTEFQYCFTSIEDDELNWDKLLKHNVTLNDLVDDFMTCDPDKVSVNCVSETIEFIEYYLEYNCEENTLSPDDNGNLFYDKDGNWDPVKDLHGRTADDPNFGSNNCDDAD